MIVRFELSCQTRSTHRHIKRTRAQTAHAPRLITTHRKHESHTCTRAPMFFKCASIHEVESSRYRASVVKEGAPGKHRQKDGSGNELRQAFTQRILLFMVRNATAGGLDTEYSAVLLINAEA